MLHQLSQDELDLLQRQLIVPVAVSDILYHDLDVEADMQYGLHMALSEIDPDSALLAIACCAHHISKKYLSTIPIASALEKEAGDIIKEYGPTWLRHLNSAPMSSDIYESVLETVPEDLEALADLIDALCADIADESSSGFAIGVLLSIQARAHMEIADYILSEIDYEKEVEESEISGAPMPVKDDLDMEAYTGSNIIVFPGAR